MADPSIAPTLRYTLSYDDALAYETLPREAPVLQKLTFFIWLAFGVILLLALPPDLAGDLNSLRFWVTGAALVLLQYAIFVIARAALRRSRARHRYPQPVEIELERDADRFVLTENGRSRIVHFTEIGMMLPTANHLFMAVGRDLVIVPLVAFGDAAGMAGMVEEIDSFMRHHYAQELANADAIVVTDDPGLGHHHHHDG